MTQLVFPFANSARAQAFARSRNTKLHADILALLGKHDSLTRQEIADSLNKGIQSVCPAVLDLLKDGRLIEAGGFRKTRYGANASLVALPPKKPKRKRGGK